MNILKEIKELIHKYPNDQKLGNVVRYKYRDKELYEDQGDGAMKECKVLERLPNGFPSKMYFKYKFQKSKNKNPF